VDAIESGKVAKILHGIEFVVKERGVSHVADSGSGGFEIFVAENANGAAGWLEESGNDAKESGLACTVFA
jgi:hypothetical protein